MLDVACKEGLTFYDASNLTAAAEGGHKLVTDDERLLRVAARLVKASRSTELGWSPICAGCRKEVKSGYLAPRVA